MEKIYIVFAVRKMQNYNEEKPFILSVHYTLKGAMQKLEDIKEADKRYSDNNFYYYISNEIIEE